MGWVSTAKKSDFLTWFLTQHQLKNPEARRLLEYIKTNHHILTNLSFSDKIIKNERTIIISSVQSDKEGFTYYEPHSKTDAVSKAMGSIMNNPTQRLYLVLHYHGKQSDFRYSQLIEPTRLESIKQYEQSAKDAVVTDKVVEIALLKSRINKALDDRDEALFKELAGKLKKLQDS
ncbi:YpiB family protein [Bacillus weihaiensis]|uniref:IDEAL domain-containing protein n=1 Tax=Bacillus weihaiensis TaxID=1547283 RepID=A0A1L3MVW8_9BACI|nr:YpiB family protein [Bacillus weihaiensis]APH06420.1 hypothetical protein A9C19_17710 [Bacillus weihaiensis]